MEIMHLFTVTIKNELLSLERGRDMLAIERIAIGGKYKVSMLADAVNLAIKFHYGDSWVGSPALTVENVTYNGIVNVAD